VLVPTGKAGKNGSRTFKTLALLYNGKGGVTRISPSAVHSLAKQRNLPVLLLLSVSLFKAPQKGLGAKQYAEGYDPADFPGGAYFAKDRAIANDLYAAYKGSYGEGVIEVRIPADVYAKEFQEYEQPYPDDTRFLEVQIPPEKLPLLNTFPRYWYEYEEEL